MLADDLPTAVGVGLLLVGLLLIVSWRRGSSPIVPKPVTVSAFGREWPRPPWLTEAVRTYDQQNVAIIPYTSQVGKPCRAGVPPRWHRGAHADARMFAAMIESVRWDRHRRGIMPAYDDLHHAVWPEIRPEGLLVDTIERDDGSMVELVAYGISEPIEPDEYRTAEAAGIARYVSAWDKRPYALVHGEWGRYGDYKFSNPRSGIMPLFRPLIREVVRRLSPRTNPFAPPATEKGSAQFAWVDELLKSPVARLGSLKPAGAGVPLGLFRVRDWTPDKKDPRAGVVTTGWNGRDGEHRMIVGQPGTGKFTSVIAPLLLTADKASVVVFDVANGEATKLAAAHRAKIGGGGSVLVLDPFKLSGIPSGALNPLDVLRPDSPDLLETAKRLCDAIFVPHGSSGGDNFFNENAAELLLAIVAHVATWQHEPTRTLARVREIIRAPLWEYKETDAGHLAVMPCDELIEMSVNKAAGGVIADTARATIATIQAESFKTLDSIVRTLKANTAFLDMPTVQEVTARTTMDLRDLRRQVSSLFVVVPEHQLKVVGRWLRLIYTVVAEACRVSAPVPLHFVIDEFPALGRFDRVSEDMALVRKYGVSFHVVVQSLAQLKKLYGDGWETFMASAKYRQILGVNDQHTGEWVSKQLGKTTRRAVGESGQRNNRGGSRGTSKSWIAADLLSPDELNRLDRSEVIVLVENHNPLRLRKWNWFDSEYLKARTARGP